MLYLFTISQSLKKGPFVLTLMENARDIIAFVKPFIYIHEYLEISSRETIYLTFSQPKVYRTFILSGKNKIIQNVWCLNHCWIL